jgi:hypothetical protein
MKYIDVIHSFPLHNKDSGNREGATKAVNKILIESDINLHAKFRIWETSEAVQKRMRN